MGYSIATPIKSEKAKKEMMAFLRRHYNHTLDPYARGPIDRDLSYDHGPCRIGFDFNSPHDYVASLCAWIALKVGKRKMYPTKQCDKVHGPYKYIVYDGMEDWPLYITSTWRAGLPQLVKINWVGCLVPHLELWDRIAGRKKNLRAIEEELKRLDALWLKQL